jgi:hypothetical protein
MYIADTPLRRLEQPEGVARVVAFLVSEDAGFMAGEAVAVNGGAFMDCRWRCGCVEAPRTDLGRPLCRAVPGTQHNCLPVYVARPSGRDGLS